MQAGDPTKTSISFVGDLMPDVALPRPRVFYHSPETTSCHLSLPNAVRFPYPADAETLAWLEEQGVSTRGMRLTSHAHQSIRLAPRGGLFDAIRSELGRSEAVVVNLECPLSTRGRRARNDCCYRADPQMAFAMAWSGIRAASLANNHAMDFGETALRETVETLTGAGVVAVGVGESQREASQPRWLEVNGTKVALVAGNMVGPDDVYATEGEYGVAMLNPMLTGRAIAEAREAADVVVVLAHWGIEGRAEPLPELASFARDMVERGADLVIGHHPHVVGPVEVHQGRAILYSLGNFLFGHDHAAWSGGVIARALIAAGRIEAIELTATTAGLRPAPKDLESQRRLCQLIQRTSDQAEDRTGIEDGRVLIQLS